MKRLVVGLIVAGVLATVLIIAGQADSGGICPLICPWSSLCVPPLCTWPPDGGGSGA